MRTILLPLIVSLVSFTVNAQLTFQKTYGGTQKDEGKAIVQTADGGYILAGHTYSAPADSQDVYLVKTNAAGDTLWTHTYGGANTDWANAVQQTSDMGYIIAGGTTSYGAFNELPLLIKTNATGAVTWAKTIGGANINDAYSVQQTTDGGYIFSGVTLSYGAGGADAYLVKMNALGDTVWTRTFGGTGIDYGAAVQELAGGGYVMAGYTSSFGTGTDIYLTLVNQSGTLLISKSIGGTGYDRATAVRQTSDGGFILCGYTNSFGAGGWDVYVIKTNLSGSVTWAQTYGTASDEIAYAVRQTADGGYIVSGTTSLNGTDVFLMKLTATGAITWVKSYGGTGNESNWDVKQTTDGGYITLRGTMSFGAGNQDVYVVKTDASGNSGCNTSPVNFIAGSNIVPAAATATIISYGANVASVSPAVKSGSKVTNLCSSVGIEEDGLPEAMTVYPNPSSGTFTFAGTGFTIARIDIFNTLGESVFSSSMDRSSSVDLSGQPAGIYFYRVVSPTGISSGKLVIE